MMRKADSCERLRMMPSVIPSDRYSTFGSAPTLASGKMAIESMTWFCVGRLERRGGCLFKSFDINPKFARRAQSYLLLARQDKTRVCAGLQGWLQRPPRRMNAFVQIVGRRLRIEVRPQEFHRLLAMELMMRLQGQELDQQLGLAPRPTAFFDCALIHCDAERAEQVNR